MLKKRGSRRSNQEADGRQLGTWKAIRPLIGSDVVWLVGLPYGATGHAPITAVARPHRGRLLTCTVQFLSGPIRQATGKFENLLPELRRNPRPNLHQLLPIGVNLRQALTLPCPK